MCNLHTKFSPLLRATRPKIDLRSRSQRREPLDMPRARAIVFSAIGGALAAVLTANLAFAHDRGDGFGRRHRDGELMFLLPLLLLAAAAVLLVVLWRGRHPVTLGGTAPAAAASPTLNAQSILAERLARGEISPDDYRAAITVLRETPAPPAAG